MRDQGLLARFQAAYTEEAERSVASPHAAKHRYGNVAWNEEIALPLVDSAPSVADELYTWALAEAYRIDDASGVRLKKGVEYCNLGVAQKNQGKLRDAYESFGLAEREDIDHGDASHAGMNVLEGMLLLPGGDALVTLVDEFVASTASSRALISDVRQFWVRISREHRFQIREVLPECLDLTGDTESTSSYRLAAWTVLARIVEDLLREKHGTGGGRINLHELLRLEFGTAEASQLFNRFLLPTAGHGEVTPANIDVQLADALTWTADPLTNSMIVFYLVRNYTAHYARSAVYRLGHYAEFRQVLCYLAAFGSRIGLPIPVPGAFSPARLPVGVSSLPFGLATPVEPDLTIIEEWAQEVAQALTGMSAAIAVTMPAAEAIRLSMEFPQAVPDRDGLVRYLDSCLSIGGHFDVSVTVVP